MKTTLLLIITVIAALAAGGIGTSNGLVGKQQAADRPMGRSPINCPITSMTIDRLARTAR